MFNEDFGRRIQQAARRKKITQKELARRVYTTSSAMSGYCVGRSEPTLETVACIARELGVSADYLLGLSDRPEPCESEKECLNRVRGQVEDLAGEAKKMLIKIEQIQKMINQEGKVNDQS